MLVAVAVGVARTNKKTNEIGKQATKAPHRRLMTSLVYATQSEAPCVSRLRVVYLSRRGVLKKYAPHCLLLPQGKGVVVQIVFVSPNNMSMDLETPVVFCASRPM